MYTNVKEIHRPATMDEAIRLLARTDVPTAPLYISPRPLEGLLHAEAAVDLSGLGLDTVRVTEAGVTLGAAASLEAILKSPIGGTPAGALICEACLTTAHSGIRAVASAGGAIVCGGASDLLLALLALDAICVLRGPGAREIPLAELSIRPGELLVEVRVPAPRGALGAALERVARTPRDRSIVAAAAALEFAGDVCTRARLALSGLASMSLRWAAAEKELEGQRVWDERIAAAAATVDADARPAGDHLGSAEYRRTMGMVLARRALAAAWGRAVNPRRA